MISKILTVILFLCSCCHAAVHFEGNRHFKVTALMELKKQTASLSQLVDAITTNYVDEGYFLAVVRPEIVAGDTTLKILEGRQLTFASLRFSGVDDSLVTELALLHRPTQPLTNEVLAAVSDDLVKRFAENGYPFCTVKVANLSVVDDTLVMVKCKIITGPLTDVGEVSFSGLTTTKVPTLLNRLQLRRGPRFQESRLAASENSLSHLSFCQLTRPPELLFDSRTNSVDISFPMKEERSILVNGMVFLNPDNSLAGQSDISLQNPFGTGEEFRFFWSRQDRLSRKLSFESTLPYIGGYPIDINAKLLQEERDSSYVNTSATLTTAYHLLDRWSLGAGASWGKVTPVENQPSPSARLYSVQLGSRVDRRDNVRNTRSGYWMEQDFKSAYRKSFLLDQSISSGYSTHLDADARIWKRLSNNVTFYQRVYAFQIRSDFNPIPADQLISIGGAETLRGYRENTFLASAGIVSSSELRWFALENLTLRLFADNAYLKTPSVDLGLTGFGAGMSVVTTVGDFRFDMSLGQEKRLSKMLVHFGFEGKL